MNRDTLPALLLAAGASARMQGGQKLLLDWRGKSLLRHAYDVLLEGGCGQVVCVLGGEADRLRAELPAKTQVVVNTAFAAGMAGSIVMGIGQVPPESAGVLIALADMPFVSPALVSRLRALFFQHGGEKIIVPVHGERRGNPVVFPRRFFAELRSLRGDSGARWMIAGHEHSLVLCPVEDERVFLDIDTREAYEQALALAEGRET